MISNWFQGCHYRTGNSGWKASSFQLPNHISRIHLPSKTGLMALMALMGCSSAAPNLSSFWSSSFNRESTSWSQSLWRAHMLTRRVLQDGEVMGWCAGARCVLKDTVKENEASQISKTSWWQAKSSRNPCIPTEAHQEKNMKSACSSSSSFSGTSVRSGEGEVVSAVSERSRRSHSSRSSEDAEMMFLRLFWDPRICVFHLPFLSIPIHSHQFSLKVSLSKTSSSGGAAAGLSTAAAAAAAAAAASSSAFGSKDNNSNNGIF